MQLATLLALIGSAVLAAAWGADPHMGIGFLGVSLAFGLTVLSMAAAIGHISGCHLNPAVTCGLVASGRVPARDLIPYWIAQVVGGIAGAGILGLAVGFGAQTLVKDVITGFFILLENQIRVDDTITAAGCTGVVEAVNLRTTVLRDFDGTTQIGRAHV